MFDLGRSVLGVVSVLAGASAASAGSSAFSACWAWLSERLEHQRFLMGAPITEADIRLFTTLARFDAVYHGHFECNRHKLTGFSVLWAYARDLFQTSGFGDSINFAQIKEHY